MGTTTRGRHDSVSLDLNTVRISKHDFFVFLDIFWGGFWRIFFRRVQLYQLTTVVGLVRNPLFNYKFIIFVGPLDMRTFERNATLGTDQFEEYDLVTLFYIVP